MISAGKFSKLFIVLNVCLSIHQIDGTSTDELNDYLDQYPNIVELPNFDYKKFLGKWFAMEEGYDLHGRTIDCAVFNYKILDPATSQLELDDAFKVGGVVFKEPIKNGKILPCKNNCGKFIGDFHVPLPLNQGGGTANNVADYKQKRWIVLDTDYEHYAIVWIEKVGIVTQSRDYEEFLPNIKDLVYKKLQGWGFDPSKLIKSNQVNCTDVHVD